MKENSKYLQLLSAEVCVGSVSLVESGSLCDCVNQFIIGWTSQLQQNNWTLQMSISLSIIYGRSLQCLVQMLLSTFQICKIRLDQTRSCGSQKRADQLVSHTSSPLNTSENQAELRSWAIFPRHLVKVCHACPVMFACGDRWTSPYRFWFSQSNQIISNLLKWHCVELRKHNQW